MPPGKYLDIEDPAKPGHRLAGSSPVLRGVPEEARALHYCWTASLKEKIQKMATAHQIFVDTECIKDVHKCDSGSTSHWSHVCTNASVPNIVRRANPVK